MKRVLFLDLDETIYPGLTIKDTARWLLAHGYLAKWKYLKILGWLFLQAIGQLDHDRAFRGGAALLRGYEIERLERAIERAYDQSLKAKISPKLREQLAVWRSEYRVVLATESLAPIAAVFAHDLGCDAVLATQLQVKDGRVTGQLIGRPLFGQVKVAVIKQWARENSVDLARSVAVGGRADDTPMLEAVGTAIILNPDETMRILAQERSWPIQDL